MNENDFFHALEFLLSYLFYLWSEVDIVIVPNPHQLTTEGKHMYSRQGQNLFEIYPKSPEDMFESVYIHILNSLKSWNFDILLDIPNQEIFSNVDGG